MKTINRTIEFLDAENNKVIFNAEITTRNNYFEFTASGEYAGSMGQCFDHVKPANDNQKALIDIWHKYHLNGMNAGTPEQSEYLTNCVNMFTPETLKQRAISGYQKILLEKAWNKNHDEFLKYQQENRKAGIDMSFGYSEENTSKTDEEEAKIFANENTPLMINEATKTLENKNIDDYYFKCGLLREAHLLEVKHPKTGEPYKYGCGWIINELPEDFDTILTDLLDAIEEEEEEKRERKVTEEDSELFTEFSEPETVHALALMLDLCVNEIEDIEENNNCRYTVQGVDYLAGTDDEMDEEWNNYLDSYIDDCVEIPAEIENFFDRDKYINYLKQDGRGHSLNSYNGDELEINLNGVYYYAYRN
jgi:hypothetical protein